MLSQQFDVGKKDVVEVQGDDFPQKCQDAWEQVAGKGDCLKKGGVLMIMRNLKMKGEFPCVKGIDTGNDKEVAQLMESFDAGCDKIKKDQFPMFMKSIMKEG